MSKRWGLEPFMETDDPRSLTFARRRAGPFGVSVRAYRSDFVQEVHSHAHAVIDLNLVGGGRGVYGREERESRPGEVEGFAPGVPHTFRSGPRGIRTLHVSFVPSDLPDELRAPVERWVGGAYRMPGLESLRLGLGVLDAARGPGAWDAAHVEGLCWGLVGSVFGASELGERGRRSPVWIGRVLEMIRATGDRPLGLAELADIAGVHRGSLARTFLAATGRTTGEYHREVRLQDAARRIADGEDAATVARATGFADQPHLCRLFHERVGRTPAAFARTLGVPTRRRAG